jgi:hypothetical protein
VSGSAPALPATLPRQKKGVHKKTQKKQQRDGDADAAGVAAAGGGTTAEVASVELVELEPCHAELSSSAFSRLAMSAGTSGFFARRAEMGMASRVEEARCEEGGNHSGSDRAIARALAKQQRQAWSTDTNRTGWLAQRGPATRRRSVAEALA